MTEFLLFWVEKLKLFGGLDLDLSVKSWVEKTVGEKLIFLDAAMDFACGESLWVVMVLYRVAMASAKW